MLVSTVAFSSYSCSCEGGGAKAALSKVLFDNLHALTHCEPRDKPYLERLAEISVRSIVLSHYTPPKVPKSPMPYLE